jgi:hypothetical protein
MTAEVRMEIPLHKPIIIGTGHYKSNPKREQFALSLRFRQRQLHPLSRQKHSIGKVGQVFFANYVSLEKFPPAFSFDKKERFGTIQTMNLRQEPPRRKCSLRHRLVVSLDWLVGGGILSNGHHRAFNTDCWISELEIA